MNNTKLRTKVKSRYLLAILSTLLLPACNADALIYSKSDVGKMIPLKLANLWDNYYASVGGSAISGVNPDSTLDVFLDTGSTILVVPEDYVNMSKVKVLESCVSDYWGNVDDLVQGQVSLPSTDGTVNYTVESYTFYAVRNINNQCASHSGGTLNDNPYYTPGTMPQRQLIMGTGSSLEHPVYNSHAYCIGGFFNFLDYAQYSPTGQAIFSIITFGGALSSPPNPESKIPYSLQSYISVGLADRQSNVTYTPVNRNNSNAQCPSNVQSSWGYQSRIPASITVNKIKVPMPLGQSPDNSTIPYGGVDTGGGGLGFRDGPGNPAITALKKTSSLTSQSNGCYFVKPNVPISIQLYNGTTPTESYSYGAQAPSWGAYYVSICENGTDGGYNLGFPLFYAASTVSFDFTNQRLGVTLGKLPAPRPIPQPKFFCSDWMAQYNTIPNVTWGTMPQMIRNLWDLYNCNERVLNPTHYLANR